MLQRQINHKTTTLMITSTLFSGVNYVLILLLHYTLDLTLHVELV
jgi:hypothetical protein